MSSLVAQPTAEEYDNDSRAGDADDEESREVSPTPSEALSVYSYVSSQNGHLILRDVFGRTVNSTNDYYMLPADPEEHSRLDMQHEMLKKKMGGLFLVPNAVRRAMAPRQDQEPAAMDIGTGSGMWVVEMAKLFPHAEIVGLDLVPAHLSTPGPYHSPPPANCRFEVDDATLGLDHYKNCFNVVNIRCVSTGIPNFRRLLRDAAHTLRPEGVLLTVDGDMQLYDENYEPITAERENEKGFAWMQKLISAVGNAQTERNPDCTVVHQMGKLLGEMDDWEEYGTKQYWIPVGPWEEGLNERDRYVAELMRQNFLRMIGAVRPLLLTQGYFEQTLDKWAAKVQDEVVHLKHKTYTKWHCAWAIKKRR